MPIQSHPKQKMQPWRRIRSRPDEKETLNFILKEQEVKLLWSVPIGGDRPMTKCRSDCYRFEIKNGSPKYCPWTSRSSLFSTLFHRSCFWRLLGSFWSPVDSTLVVFDLFVHPFWNYLGLTNKILAFVTRVCKTLVEQPQTTSSKVFHLTGATCGILPQAPGLLDYYYTYLLRQKKSTRKKKESSKAQKTRRCSVIGLPRIRRSRLLLQVPIGCLSYYVKSTQGP